MAHSSDLVMTGASADELWPLVRDYHYSRLNGWSEQPFPKPDFAARLLDEQGTPLSEPGANPGGRSTIAA